MRYEINETEYGIGLYRLGEDGKRLGRVATLLSLSAVPGAIERDRSALEQQQREPSRAGEIAARVQVMAQEDERLAYALRIVERFQYADKIQPHERQAVEDQLPIIADARRRAAAAIAGLTDSADE